MRREFSAKVKLAAWERCGGNCEGCHARIIGRAEYDHILPDALGGEPTLENLQVLCTKCHRIKTSTGDVPRIAKAKRQQRKAIGVWPKSSRPLRSRGFPKRAVHQESEV
jgi:5-methylcytosine-specific restriction endonuclease McrA